MYTYIQVGIRDYVPLKNKLPEADNVIATDWEGYLKGGWLLLSDEQLAFKEANPDASKNEVFRMELAPVIEPEPHVPTREEKTMQLMSMLLPTTINTIPMDNNTALYYQEFHPHWVTFVGGKLSKGDRVQHNGRLFRLLQDVLTVIANQEPGSVGMAAIYEEINETHAGTLQDPIPYDHVAGMFLEAGLFYTEDGIVGECIESVQSVWSIADLIAGGRYMRGIETEE